MQFRDVSNLCVSLEPRLTFRSLGSKLLVYILSVCVNSCTCVYVCPFQLNPDVSAFQRKFTNDVRRCDEMERKLRFLLNELEKAGIEPRPSGSVEAPDPQGEKYRTHP